MKRWMKGLLLFLAVVMMAGGSVWPASASMLDMTGFEDNADNLSVSKVPRGKAGNKISIKMNIHNTGEKGDNDYKKIKLVSPETYNNLMGQLVNNGEEEDYDTDLSLYNKYFPFEADSSTFQEKEINVKPGSSKAISLSYKLRRDLPEGYYQVFFEIDRSITVGLNIWVSAYDGKNDDSDSTDSDYEFSVGDGQLTPYGVYGQVLNYGVNLTNTGSRRVYDVRVDMQLDRDSEKFPFDINEGNYLRRMGTMEAGEMVTVPYSMAVRDDVKSGFFPITYRITYREEEGGDFAEPVDKVVYVRIKGEDDDDLSEDAGEQDRTKARIIVDSFETIPAEIYAGQPFELKIRMKNASTGVNASNIMFTLESEEVENSPVFTSDTGSTSVVVNSMAPGAVSEVSMIFKASPTAEQKSYRMTIKEQYDSPEFKNAKEEVKISLPVKQEPRLNTGTIEVMPDQITVGSETNVMFGINNTGKVLLYNVMARFEADSIQSTDTYVGNIKPGETGNVDAMITGIAPTADEGKVKIIISYEDENGAVTEVEKEMQLFVNEAMEEFGGMDGMDGMDGIEDADAMAGNQGFVSKFWKQMLLLILVAAAGTVIGLRHRKKKKAAAEEEGMDDEIL